ncbi:MAG: EthD family reductase [Candidatus Sericytochromatia bacterium]|nr:EthD family reductase [Candidatus Sericytochromatia bacterium]
MFTFMATYATPENPEEFERRYREEHLPLLARVPGLQSCTVLKPSRQVVGTGADTWMVALVHFEDAAAFKAAARTPEWAAAGANIQEIAGTGWMAHLADAEEWTPASVVGAGA